MTPNLNTGPSALESRTTVPPLLSVVVPSFNEAENVPVLVERLTATLGDIAWEVVFVDDDSKDGTADVVRSLASATRHVRCVQRIGRRGLSSACIEGILATSSPYVCVMDADLQHDESIIPRMLSLIRCGSHDLVIGSRFITGGDTDSWSQSRLAVSQFATLLSRAVVPRNLRDPMSGFFMITRDAFMQRVRGLSGLGFKLLVDLLATPPCSLRFIEVPYSFRTRLAGESKLDRQVAWDYLMLLLDKRVGWLLPVRFASFALVGCAGIAVHMTALLLLMRYMHTPFVAAQTAATCAAIASNFQLNNAITYRDRRLRGKRWAYGLASFFLICGVGAIANVGVAYRIFDAEGAWLPAAAAGMFVSAVWNFAVTATYTWSARPR